MRKVSFRFSIIQCYLLLTIVTTTVICSVFYIYSKEAVITLANKIISEVSSKTNDQVADFIAVPEMQEQVISRLVTAPNILTLSVFKWFETDGLVHFFVRELRTDLSFVQRTPD